MGQRLIKEPAKPEKSKKKMGNGTKCALIIAGCVLCGVMLVFGGVLIMALEATRPSEDEAARKQAYEEYLAWQKEQQEIDQAIVNGDESTWKDGWEARSYITSSTECNADPGSIILGDTAAVEGGVHEDVLSGTGIEVLGVEPDGSGGCILTYKWTNNSDNRFAISKSPNVVLSRKDAGDEYAVKEVLNEDGTALKEGTSGFNPRISMLVKAKFSAMPADGDYFTLRLPNCDFRLDVKGSAAEPAE